MFKLLAIIGILLLVSGIVLTQYSVRIGEKSIAYSDTVLTSNNSTIYVDLGKLKKDTYVIVSWMADPIVAFMMFKTGSKEVIATTTNPKSPHTGSRTITVHSGGDFSPSFYFIEEVDDYTLSIFLPDAELLMREANWDAERASSLHEIRIAFMKIDVLPPITYPYSTLGTGLAVVGIVAFVLGLMKSRK